MSNEFEAVDWGAIASGWEGASAEAYNPLTTAAPGGANLLPGEQSTSWDQAVAPIFGGIASVAKTIGDFQSMRDKLADNQAQRAFNRDANALGLDLQRTQLQARTAIAGYNAAARVAGAQNSLGVQKALGLVLAPQNLVLILTALGVYLAWLQLKKK